MTASLETLVVTAYLFADELAIPRPGPQGAITDAELIALAVAQAAIGIPSDRQFLGLVGKLLPGWFPHLPSLSQYNRRLRRLAPTLAAVQLRVAELIAASDLRIADGTLIAVANYAGCASHSEFAGTAAYGYCVAKSQYVWGMRLVLVTDPAGVPLGYTLEERCPSCAGPNESERPVCERCHQNLDRELAAWLDFVAVCAVTAAEPPARPTPHP